MKFIKKVLFSILTIIVFNVCYDEIASVWDWLYFDAFFIAHWILIPSAAVLLMTIIKFWLFREQSMWMLFIAFLINLMVMIPYGYYLQMYPAPNDLYINIVMYLIIMATVSALLQSFLVSLVYILVKKRLKHKDENHRYFKPEGLGEEVALKQKSGPLYIGITIIIFYVSFFTVVFFADIGIISGSNGYWIFSPIIPVILLGLIKQKYFAEMNPWFLVLGFFLNFALWLFGALLRYLIEGNFLSSFYGQVAIVSTLSAVGFSLIYSLILWIVWKRRKTHLNDYNM